VDCVLGVGGPDGETIAEVFQLNETQREKLKNWTAELRIRNDYLRDKAERLIGKNQASPPDELLKVSVAYRAILDSMEQNIRMMDRRLLQIFNDRQYRYYVELCGRLSLRPIHINRSVDER